MILLILVPKPGTDAERRIDHGSGIVRLESTEDPVLVYFEGNRFGAVNLVTYQDRVKHAAGRLLANYPTVARAAFGRDEFLTVGYFDSDTRQIHVTNGEAVDDWTVAE